MTWLMGKIYLQYHFAVDLHIYSFFSNVCICLFFYLNAKPEQKYGDKLHQNIRNKDTQRVLSFNLFETRTINDKLKTAFKYACFCPTLLILSILEYFEFMVIAMVTINY